MNALYMNDSDIREIHGYRSLHSPPTSFPADSGFLFGIGVDLVDIRRLTEALTTWSRLSKRLFTAGELGEADKRRSGARSGAEFLAGRFAAKEATFKALGLGWPQISWVDVEVIAAASGAPMLALHRRAAQVAEGRRTHVSISHSGGFALGYVAIERNQTAVL